MIARRDSRTRGHLLPGFSYFEYQRIVCRDVVLPWLERRLELEGLVVGDFGAHHGGMVDALRESGRVAGAIGLELSEDVVASSPFVADEHFRLEAADVLALGPDIPKFDVVLLHDVLEHIPDYDRALRAVHCSLARDGHVFVSFPPYYSAFGGHQQYARGLARFTPFVHLLPARLFYRVARPGEQEYMTAEGAHEDLVSVRSTRLTLGAAERAFSSSGLQIVDRELFLVRPEYTVRYELKARGAGVLGKLPGVRELGVNGAFYLLRPASPLTRADGGADD
ncbi:MAG: class I SAM-dependent methyltransferase [Gaiellaceae bacterium]